MDSVYNFYSKCNTKTNICCSVPLNLIILMMLGKVINDMYQMTKRNFFKKNTFISYGMVV